jgi:hypothetical protein
LVLEGREDVDIQALHLIVEMTIQSCGKAHVNAWRKESR